MEDLPGLVLDPSSLSGGDSPPHSSSLDDDEDLSDVAVRSDDIIAAPFEDDNNEGDRSTGFVDHDETLLQSDENASASLPMARLQDFKCLLQRAEQDMKLVELEESNVIRAANRRILPHDSQEQVMAQYGRILPDAVDIVLRKVLEVTSNDVFVDMGHGVGSVALQAVLTTDCEGRGIELIQQRHDVALQLQTTLEELHGTALNVRWRRGALQAPEHRTFLTVVNDPESERAFFPTTEGDPKIKAFCNNFNEVFGEKAGKKGDLYCIDDFLAGLFALMQPGSVLVTASPLNLGHVQQPKAANYRALQGLSNEFPHLASFYEFEKIPLGPANQVVSWSQYGSNKKMVYLYKYTRIDQKNDGTAVFLCCNPACPKAQAAEPIAATQQVWQRGEKLVINHCECKFGQRNLRQRVATVYTEERVTVE